MKDSINQLFANLDAWRHFPAYQLERRADIFFSIYLPEYLSTRLKSQVQMIVPEVPIRIGALTGDSKHQNESFKADYLAIVRHPNRAILLEIKTEIGSIRPEQLAYLKQAKSVGFQSLLQGLRSIYRASSSKAKYRHLLRALSDAKLIVNMRDDDFDMPEQDCQIEILYLLPTGEGDNILTFRQFAEMVDKRQDDLSKRFAESLVRWSTTRAGAGVVTK